MTSKATLRAKAKVFKVAFSSPYFLRWPQIDRGVEEEIVRRIAR